MTIEPICQGSKILVVDDEHSLVNLCLLIFEQAGYHVRGAFSGKQALQMVGDEMPDLILLDVMMPGMDGFTVCEKLRSEPATAELPIIMLSAKTDLDSINKGLRAGATVYLTKPISPEELTQHVRDALVQFDEDV